MNRLSNPALDTISGTIDRGATWNEDIVLTDDDGAQLTDVDDHTWTLTLYRNPGCAAELTLSTSDGTLTIEEGASETVLGIRCAPSRLSSLCGDYYCDIKSSDPSPTVDGAAHVFLWARGIVTVVQGAS